MKNCFGCNLANTRINQVYPAGGFTAKILFLAVSPSLSEDLLGKAFVSDSNKLVKTMIERAGIKLDECYFSYMVLCRSTDSKKSSNRFPLQSEILACMPRILDIFNDVHFQAVVFLDKEITKIYKSKLSCPHITITEPSLIKLKGGVKSNLFIDNTNKLERFYDSITSE